jgi:hypothetical protein
MLRKSIALFSVFWLLAAIRCVANCTVSVTEFSTHDSAPAVPPCHHHQHQPDQGTQNSVPCQDHPGLLAYSLHQPSPFLSARISMPGVAHELTPDVSGALRSSILAASRLIPSPRSPYAPDTPLLTVLRI